MKKWLAITFLLFLFSCIGLLFWYTEWKYNLPTPVREKYHAVNIREKIDIKVEFISQKKLPVLLNYFNPGCPNSGFNITHFKFPVSQYTDKISFAVVVMTNDKAYVEKN